MLLNHIFSRGIKPPCPNPSPSDERLENRLVPLLSPVSCLLVKENALLLLKRLENISDSQRVRLAQFIINRCFLVVVSTPDMDSAYRIFSVLNDRGLDLSLTDILKAEIIGQIPDSQKEEYTLKWEKIEADLGRDPFKDFFSHIRMIYRKAKLGDTVLKEIRAHIHLLDNSQQFIDEIIIPLADAFYDINNVNDKS